MADSALRGLARAGHFLQRSRAARVAEPGGRLADRCARQRRQREQPTILGERRRERDQGSDPGARREARLRRLVVGWQENRVGEQCPHAEGGPRVARREERWESRGRRAPHLQRRLRAGDRRYRALRPGGEARGALRGGGLQPRWVAIVGVARERLARQRPLRPRSRYQGNEAPDSPRGGRQLCGRLGGRRQVALGRHQRRARVPRALSLGSLHGEARGDPHAAGRGRVRHTVARRALGRGRRRQEWRARDRDRRRRVGEGADPPDGARRACLDRFPRQDHESWLHDERPARPIRRDGRRLHHQ